MENANIITIEKFLSLAKTFPVFDVRTPAEFSEGHIPGAQNLPLFSNEERAEIGTLYKQNGSREALLKGLDHVGPKMRLLVETTEQLSPQKTVLLHCWRGGMRSRSVAWLLGFAGFKTCLLEGGYKAFREYARSIFQKKWQVNILSGYTGSGKTDILKCLAPLGEQTVDLEGLAHHKGSSFGGLGEMAQPSQQQFENKLAIALACQELDRPVWLEDESRKIGWRIIPDSLWERMREGNVFFLDMPLPLRVVRLEQDYGSFAKNDLKEGVLRLQKRLGGLQTKQAIEALEKDDINACTEILLQHYYDKTYRHGLLKRDAAAVLKIETNTAEASKNAILIQQTAKKSVVG